MIKVINLESRDGRWKADVCTNYGANVIRLTFDGNDVLVPLESEMQLKENPYIQGAPLLLPANRTYKGEFTFEGNQYRLPLNEPSNNSHLHGLLHTQSFKVISATRESVVLSFCNRGKIYPFFFDIEVEYSLAQNAFEQYFRIKNTGGKNMPLTFALHTSFREPQNFSVPVYLCQEKDSHHIPTGRYVILNEQEALYPVGSKSKGIEISGYYKSCGNTAKIGDFYYTVSDNFDHWILFNGKGEKNLLCVEPQCGAVNGLNIKNGCKILLSGETVVFSTCIHL
jgi:aldose 1-epimerase